MAAVTRVQTVSTRRELTTFIKLPWKIYADDKSWIPPLVSDQLVRLDPSRSAFHSHAEVRLFLAYHGKEAVGRIAAFIDHRRVAHLSRQVGGFGFFETFGDYSIAEALLDTAVDWLWERNIAEMIGPTCFTEFEYPGILVDGFEHPPVVMAAHSPPYYKDYLITYGLERYQEFFTWRIVANQIKTLLQELEPSFLSTTGENQAVRNFKTRKLKLEDWEAEIRSVHNLVNEGLKGSPSYVPISADDFLQIMNLLRIFIDPDLIRIAEADGKPIAVYCAVPDRNQLLKQINGRLTPFSRPRVRRLIRQIDTAMLLFTGALEGYQGTGLEGQLCRETLQAIQARGSTCLAGNELPGAAPGSAGLKGLLGAKSYRQYQLFKLNL